MLSDVRCLMRQIMLTGMILQHNCYVAIGTELELILVQPHAHPLKQAPVRDVHVNDSKARRLIVHQEAVSAAPKWKAEGACGHSVVRRIMRESSAGDDKLHIRQVLHTTTGATALSSLT